MRKHVGSWLITFAFFAVWVGVLSILYWLGALLGFSGRAGFATYTVRGLLVATLMVLFQIGRAAWKRRRVPT
jgi:hypothetical protein